VDLRVAPVSGRARIGMAVQGGELILTVASTRPVATRAAILSVDERLEVVGGELWRSNRLMRQLSDERSGRTVGLEVIGENRKRLVPSSERRRNCYTCDERACPDREDREVRAVELHRELRSAP
jgi:hypothetical protein